MFRENIRLFHKTRHCFIPVILYMFVVSVITIADGCSQFHASGGLMDGVSVVNNVIANIVFGGIVFMYAACEYISQSKKHHVYECIDVASGHQDSGSVSQFLVCLLYSGVISLILLLLSCLFFISCHIFSPSLLLYLVKIYFFYYFLIITGFILLGWFFSYIENEVLKYIAMVILCFYFIIRANQLFYRREILGALSDLTQFFCISASWESNFGFLLPVEMHFIVKPVLFVLITILLLFIQKARFWKRKWRVCGIGVCIAFNLIALSAWHTPVSGCYFGYMYDAETENENKADADLSQDNDFFVKTYDIAMTIDNGLSAVVKLSLSDTTLPSYNFTLYEGYHITHLCDENGEELSYHVDGNIIEVLNPYKSLLQIEITYEGIGTNKFYSGSQGVFLAGNFPYYPIAGKHSLYSPSLLQLPEEMSFFKADIAYSQDMMSNLNQDEKGHFEGYSNNFTLVSGLWEEQDLDNITYIYPVGASYKNPLYNDNLRQTVIEYQDKTIDGQRVTYNLQHKKILIYPYDMSRATCMFGVDIVMIGSGYDLTESYENFLKTGNWTLEQPADTKE